MDVVAGPHAAVAAGAATADAVAVEARKHADQRTPTRDATTSRTTASRGEGSAWTGPAAPARVVSLTERRLADPAAVLARLPVDTRPVPGVAHYDELLLRRHPAPSTPPVPDTGTATSTGSTS